MMPSRPYRGPDRRRVSRGADQSIGWIAATAGLVAVAAFTAALAAAGDAVVPEAGSKTLVALLRVAGAVGALGIAALVGKRAVLTGEAVPRLAAAAVLLLAAVVGAVELPKAPGAGQPPILLTLRAAGLLSAAGLLTPTLYWPTVDTGLRLPQIAIMTASAMVGVAAVVSLALAGVGVAGAGGAINGLVTAGLLGVGATLAWRGWRVGRRLAVVGGLLLVAWGVAQLPLVAGLSSLVDVAAVLEGLRVAAVAVATIVALNDLETSFVAQRHALLRTEVDRQTVEARLQAHRENDQQRAHEARSALTAIEGASTMLARYQAGLDDDGRVALSSAIHAEIRRLQHLVDAERPAEPEPLLVNELVGDEVSLSRGQGMAVHVDVPGDLQVFAERDAVVGVLRNLLVNARTHAPRATVWVTAALDNGEVVVRVGDDGPGLSAEDLARAFERGHRGQSAQRPGSGIGLHVARTLAERDGGSLTADSVPGQGATFELRLPAAAGVARGLDEAH